MSVGPSGGIVSSAAGAPLAQTKGSDVERAGQDTSAQQRRVKLDQKADSAAGIGETDGEDHQTGERDADGRRLLEHTPQAESDEEPSPEADSSSEDRQSRDSTGQSGNLLDLNG